jgi:uncharacterized protein (DUF2235 family)
MKRLAIFLDGTWNTINNNTNVWRLKSLTTQSVDQYVYYSQGVGTRRGESARGGITGYGIDEEIIDAYAWLIQNFDEGDEIFIFGFSRGAYTARSLSGLICKCGILELGAPLSIEQLYDRYRLYDAPTIRTLLAHGLPQNASIEDQWLVKYSRLTKIKCVGVWDTVGSLGLPLGSVEAKVHKYRFLDTHLRLDNEYAFHALALDEHRKNFEPTFWTRTVKTGETGAPERPIEKVEQRWFSGAHANVGGGYASDPLAQRPLKWLMEKAAAAGLVFRRSQPSRPVLALHVADVGRAAVGLYPEQLLEVDLLAFGFQFRGALLGRLHEGVLRGWHAPPRRDEFAALGSAANDRRLVVRKHARRRRQVADVAVDHAEKRTNGSLVGGDRV